MRRLESERWAMCTMLSSIAICTRVSEVCSDAHTRSSSGPCAEKSSHILPSLPVQSGACTCEWQIDLQSARLGFEPCAAYT